MFLFETPLYCGFECFKVLGQDGKTCSLTVSSECDKVLTTLFEQLHYVDMLWTPTARDELIALILECYGWLAKGFGQSTGDETDDTMLDIRRIIEEDSFVAIHHFERMLDEMFGRGFPFAIEILELCENRIELVFSCEQKRESLVGAIHATCRVDTRSDMESDDIRVHILVFSFDELTKPAGTA